MDYMTSSTSEQNLSNLARASYYPHVTSPVASADSGNLFSSDTIRRPVRGSHLTLTNVGADSGSLVNSNILSRSTHASYDPRVMSPDAHALDYVSDVTSDSLSSLSCENIVSRLARLINSPRVTLSESLANSKSFANSDTLSRLARVSHSPRVTSSYTTYVTSPNAHVTNSINVTSTTHVTSTFGRSMSSEDVVNRFVYATHSPRVTLSNSRSDSISFLSSDLMSRPVHSDTSTSNLFERSLPHGDTRRDPYDDYLKHVNFLNRNSLELYPSVTSPSDSYINRLFTSDITAVPNHTPSRDTRISFPTPVSSPNTSFPETLYKVHQSPVTDLHSNHPVNIFSSDWLAEPQTSNRQLQDHTCASSLRSNDSHREEFVRSHTTSNSNISPISPPRGNMNRRTSRDSCIGSFASTRNSYSSPHTSPREMFLSRHASPPENSFSSNSYMPAHPRNNSRSTLALHYLDTTGVTSPSSNPFETALTSQSRNNSYSSPIMEYRNPFEFQLHRVSNRGANRVGSFSSDYSSQRDSSAPGSLESTVKSIGDYQQTPRSDDGFASGESQFNSPSIVTDSDVEPLRSNIFSLNVPPRSASQEELFEMHRKKMMEAVIENYTREKKQQKNQSMKQVFSPSIAPSVQRTPLYTWADDLARSTRKQEEQNTTLNLRTEYRSDRVLAPAYDWRASTYHQPIHTADKLVFDSDRHNKEQSRQNDPASRPLYHDYLESAGGTQHKEPTNSSVSEHLFSTNLSLNSSLPFTSDELILGGNTSRLDEILTSEHSDGTALSHTNTIYCIAKEIKTILQKHQELVTNTANIQQIPVTLPSQTQDQETINENQIKIIDYMLESDDNQLSTVAQGVRSHRLYERDMSMHHTPTNSQLNIGGCFSYPNDLRLDMPLQEEWSLSQAFEQRPDLTMASVETQETGQLYQISLSGGSTSAQPRPFPTANLEPFETFCRQYGIESRTTLDGSRQNLSVESTTSNRASAISQNLLSESSHHSEIDDRVDSLLPYWLSNFNSPRTDTEIVTLNSNKANKGKQRPLFVTAINQILPTLQQTSTEIVDKDKVGSVRNNKHTATEGLKRREYTKSKEMLRKLVCDIKLESEMKNKKRTNAIPTVGHLRVEGNWRDKNEEIKEKTSVQAINEKSSTSVTLETIASSKSIRRKSINQTSLINQTPETNQLNTIDEASGTNRTATTDQPSTSSQITMTNQDSTSGLTSKTGQTHKIDQTGKKGQISNVTKDAKQTIAAAAPATEDISQPLEDVQTQKPDNDSRLDLKSLKNAIEEIEKAMTAKDQKKVKAKSNRGKKKSNKKQNA